MRGRFAPRLPKWDQESRFRNLKPPPSILHMDKGIMKADSILRFSNISYRLSRWPRDCRFWSRLSRMQAGKCSSPVESRHTKALATIVVVAISTRQTLWILYLMREILWIYYLSRETRFAFSTHVHHLSKLLRTILVEYEAV